MRSEQDHLRANEAKWDRWAGSLDTKGWKYEFLRSAQREVVSMIEAKEGLRFLDIGCGTGWAVGEAAKRFGDAGQYYGVDLSEKMVGKARANFAEKGNCHFITANAESIPLENDFFDVVICTNSFHHYLHPEKALREMHRLLRVGGKLYILDPTADSWFITALDKVMKLFEPEHVKLYSTAEFRNLFRQAGFVYSHSHEAGRHQLVHVGRKD